ncbi:MAG: hypothetical protein JWM32_205 [Verrucomicrobia bacterium]|nr:hypothetical protein [Verrucomicrobiota bacterium]
MNLKPLAVVFLLGAPALAVFGQDDEKAKADAQQAALKIAAETQRASSGAGVPPNPNAKTAEVAPKDVTVDATRTQEGQALDAQAKAKVIDNSPAAKAEQEAQRKKAEAQAAAFAAERARAEAVKKAAVDKWRASGKAASSIIVNRKSDGSVNVMVDGKLSSFKTAAEADAFVESKRKVAETTLSY